MLKLHLWSGSESETESVIRIYGYSPETVRIKIYGDLEHCSCCQEGASVGQGCRLQTRQPSGPPSAPPSHPPVALRQTRSRRCTPASQVRLQADQADQGPQSGGAASKEPPVRGTKRKRQVSRAARVPGCHT